MRVIFASEETKFKAEKTPGNKLGIYSFFPVDKADCLCQSEIQKIKERLGEMADQHRQNLIAQRKQLICPRSKLGMERYRVTCQNCGETLGYCWAKDTSLKDWCDFHYVQWSDGIQWYGCLTPHVSPITEQLCLECCCGQDTRDFRANMTLSGKLVQLYEDRNKIGREFGKLNSKFSVGKVGKDVLPFD